jgi:hypothetical protein
MTPDKYLTSGKEKQNALGIELCTLRYINRTIPIAVTWQDDLIRFWWWDEHNKKWQTRERKHRRLSDESRLPDGLSSWSERVACVPAEDRVHLIYKRHLDGTTPERAQLFIETFQVNQDVEPVVFEIAAPVPLPLLALGYHTTDRFLWAGFDEERDALLVLTVAYIPNDGRAGYEPRLVLFSVRGEFSNALNWSALDIDEGGFYLDAKREGDRLTVVYRRVAHALSFPASEYRHLPPNPREVLRQVDLATFPPDLYVPLCLRTIDLEQMIVSDAAEIHDGGDHPQIQSLSPLFITVDRLASGQLLMEPMASPYGQRVGYVTHWSNFKMQRLLLELREGTIFKTPLFTFDSLRLPRSLSFLPPHLVERFNFYGTDITYESFHRTRPLYLLAGQAWGHNITRLDLLMQGEEGVEVWRREYESYRSTMVLRNEAQIILDINHESIPDTSHLPNSFGENAQFAPFKITRWDEYLYAATYTTDNTLGALLTIARDYPDKLYFAYIDGGDGCPRVLLPGAEIPFDERRRLPAKVLLPEMVTGASLEEDVWIELESASGWVNSDLPGYEINYAPPSDLQSIGSSLQFMIDQMLTYADSLAIDLRDGLNAAELVKVQTSLARLVKNKDEFQSGAQQPNLSVSISPGNPPAGVPATYKVSFLSGDDSINGIYVSRSPTIIDTDTGLEARLGFPASDLVYSTLTESPVVILSHAFKRIPQERQVQFDAQVLPPPDERTSYTWNFKLNGNAIPYQSYSSSPHTAYVTFNETGELEITLTVRLPDGQTRMVKENTRVWPPVIYEWKINEASLPETTVTLRHVFAETGEVQVKVAAKIGGEVQSEASRTIKVFGLPTITLSLSSIVGDKVSPSTITIRTDPPATSLLSEGVALPTNGKWRCTATAVFPDGPTFSAEKDFEAAAAFSDLLWSFVAQINSNSYATLDNITLSYSDYRINLMSDGAGGFGNAKFERQPAHASQFRFLGRDGQGQVDYRMKLELQSGNVTPSPLYAPFIALDEVKAALWYGRPFTPAILHQDRRAWHPATHQPLPPELQETVRPFVAAVTSETDHSKPCAALSMKPIGPTHIEVENVLVNVRALPVLDSWEGLIALLGILGVIALVGGLTAATLTGAAIYAAKIAATALLKSAIEDALKGILASPSTQASLDAGGLLAYAGEGLAEAIAIKSINKAIAEGFPLSQPSADGDGRSRFRNQLWQTIVVTSNKCRLLLRIPERSL